MRTDPPTTNKYMDGHGVRVAPLWIAAKFDWMANAERFPRSLTPDESYHGIVYVEKFGQAGA